MDRSESPTSPKRRRWLQYRLRTLLGLTALVALGMGVWTAYIRPFRVQAAAARELLAVGARIETRAGAPAWLCRVFGAEHFQDVTAVDLEHAKFKADDLAPLSRLDRLERLYLAASTLDDEGLAHLRGLKGLKRLSLWKTDITDRGARHLEGLTGLEVLDINDTALTQECLVHLAGMTRLKKLVFWFPLNDEGLRRLADLPSLRARDYGWLACQGISGKGVRLLPLFSGVRNLRLDDCPQLTDADFEIVALLPRLEGLHVAQTPMSDPALAVIARTRCRQVELRGTAVTLRGIVDAFGARTPFVRLSPSGAGLCSYAAWSFGPGPGGHPATARIEVALTGPITDEEVAGLKRLPTVLGLAISGFGEDVLVPVSELAYIEEIACSIPVSNAGVARLAGLTTLRTLALGRLGPVTPEGMAALERLKRLERLSLHNAGIRDEHLGFLAELHQLRALSLGENPIVGPGLKHAAGLTRLEDLSLIDCPQFTDAGMKHLAGLANLRSLCIQYTQVTDEGLTHLYRLPRLRDVSMLGSRVTERGRIELSRALGLDRVLF